MMLEENIQKVILFVVTQIRNILLLALLAFFSCEENTEPISTDTLKLEGENYLLIANTTEIKEVFEGDFSIEIWATGGSDIPQTSRSLFMVGNNEGGNEVAIYQGPNFNNSINVFINDEKFGIFRIDELDWRDNKMHYFSLTRTGNFVSFYFDGEMMLRKNMLNLEINIGSSNVLIGADYDSPGVNSNVGNFWIGNFDEIRLWQKSILKEEIEFHYLNPDKLTEHFYAGFKDDLVGLWRFNQKSGDMVTDDSSHGNDALIMGNGTVVWQEFNGQN